jgi:hypothetical protein
MWNSLLSLMWVSYAILFHPRTARALDDARRSGGGPYRFATTLLPSAVIVSQVTSIVRRPACMLRWSAIASPFSHQVTQHSDREPMRH